VLAPSVVPDVATLRHRLDHARAGGGVVGFVPTLGALHAGHLSLIEAARHATDFVAVSVFVNPTQFNESADLAAYPRDLVGDVALAGRAGADLVFAPSAETMYPGGAGSLSVDPGALGEILEGAARPGHFRGVATVVTKLFGLFAPCTAYFGEKDFQQAAIVRAIARELLLPVTIVVCPTVRDEDGLALSSRNSRLAPDERRAAPVLHQALLEGRAALQAGLGVRETEALMASVVAREPPVVLEYAVVRDAASLGPPGHGPRRLLLAARVGPVRLIDNLAAQGAPRASSPMTS
jgi:pantoate--beta-alanine ligase